MKEQAPAHSVAPIEPACLVRVVTDAMKDEPALEAVKIDRSRRLVSVATLGRPKNVDLEEHLLAQIHSVEESPREQRCALMDGAPDCSGCPVPQSADQRKGIEIAAGPETTTITRLTCPTAPKFWRWHQLPWPKLVPRRVVLPGEADHDREWKEQLAAAALCLVFGLAGYFVVGQHRGPGILLYLLAYLCGSWFTFHEIRERLRERVLDVHFLMLTVAVGSAAVGAWSEGATLLFLFSLSGALEHYAMGRTQREIRSLFKTAPKVATQIDLNGAECPVPVEELQSGTRLLIKPGEQFPTDAEIARGRTAADESTLTGEAAPVEKGLGDTVMAGTLNLWGVVEVVVLRPAQESALQKIIRLIQDAQHLKAPAQRFTDKFGTGYTYAILGLSLVMFFIWWLGSGHRPFVSTPSDHSAFYRSMTLLVVASPCALVLSIPSAVLAAIAWAAKRGILFRGGAAVEKLGEVRVVAMDKTGTLTTGELKVERVESFPSGRERELAQLAYSLERLSTHPLARAITRYGKQQKLDTLELRDFESVTGLGLQARVDGETVRLGRREWLMEGSLAATFAGVPPTDAGFSEVWLTKGDVVGRVLLRDDIRPEAALVVDELRREGLYTVVLTGDRKATGENLKERLRIDEVRAELKPEGKVAAIRSFTEKDQRVAMIGDGVNDAPSLAVAHVGVAMGARGSDAALEQAEVVLMHDRLENFLTAYRLSKRARAVIRQNVVISLGTVVVLVTLAVLEGIPLTAGVLGHEGSTVVVVLNSLRLLLSGGRRPPATSNSISIKPDRGVS